MQTRRRGAPPEPLPALESKQRKREQLQEILEGIIASLEPGALLPSERLLMERYSVARGTVVQAIEALAARGLVYRVQGSGTFVAEPKFRQPLTLTSFTEDMRARGMTPGSVVRGQAIVPASEVVARHLALVPGTPVVHLERVRTADGEPMALERTHLPAQRLPGLEDVDLTDASLYELLERKWGVRVAEADQWASVVRVSEEEAALLHVSAEQPALLFQRVTRDPAGTPVEYVRSLYRGDRYEVHTRLERLG
ncbi:MAG TPA: GntR family transcriptional regulator [Actinomycetes bacterium]